MGEVYRARDTRLDRTVAIKILAAHLSSSPELRQRMEREARSISALNHSHICQLYDIGSQGGTDYLVMEFLEGETLAERLRRGPMPLAEVLKTGIAIADALAVAHRQGIVHRDLKPGNVMLTPGGAKLMDFGLAKPLGQPAGTGSGAPPSFTAIATMSGPSPLSPLTTAGTIVGTIQYMAPEQIEGKEADPRSDIFAFGAVLYEMATGKRPFEGKSQISLASAILEKDPDPVSSLKPGIPAAFAHVVSTCLQKNPEDRFQTAHDVKLQLQWIATDKPVSPAVVAALASPTPAKRWGWIAAAIPALLLGALAGWLLRQPRTVTPSIRTAINAPPGTRLNLSGDFAGPPVLSPDGTTLAFTALDKEGKTFLWVRPVDILDAHPLSGTDDATFPFWAPDSRSLGFFAGTKLKTVELNGGSAQILADAPLGRGGAWGADGVILYSPNTQDGIYRIASSGGTPVQVLKIDTTQFTSYRWPFFLPDGKHFLYLAMHHDPAKWANDTLYYASADGRENRALLHSQANGVYADGYLLFGRGDQLMAQPFDPASAKLSGEARSVAKGIMNDFTTWHMDASAHENGLLLYGVGGSADWQLVWADRSGKQTDLVADGLTNLQGASISPQGDRIALVLDNGIADVWVLDLPRNVRTRLTFGPVSNATPVWSPDGKWIAYSSDRNGQANILRKLADGSGGEEILLNDSAFLISVAWSHDGKYILYGRGSAGIEEYSVLPLDGDRKPRIVVPRAQGVTLSGATFSPDSKWLAYASSESGAPEVYVVGFDGQPGRWQVSSNGGRGPRWSADGSQILYLGRENNLLATDVAESGGTLNIGSTRELISRWISPDIFFDVSPDGKRILLDRVSQQVGESITVLTNFTSAVKK
jgi:serine/threonine protein kinase/Tol biopolymer transport system component